MAAAALLHIKLSGKTKSQTALHVAWAFLTFRCARGVIFRSVTRMAHHQLYTDVWQAGA